MASMLFVSLSTRTAGIVNKQTGFKHLHVLGVLQMFGGGYPPRNYKLTGEVSPQLCTRLKKGCLPKKEHWIKQREL